MGNCTSKLTFIWILHFFSHTKWNNSIWAFSFPPWSVHMSISEWWIEQRRTTSAFSNNLSHSGNSTWNIKSQNGIQTILFIFISFSIWSVWLPHHHHQCWSAFCAVMLRHSVPLSLPPSLAPRLPIPINRNSRNIFTCAEKYLTWLGLVLVSFKFNVVLKWIEVSVCNNNYIIDF